MKWVTRERPKIDRVACPWLIARFVDPQAEFHFVPSGEVIAAAKRLDEATFRKSYSIQRFAQDVLMPATQRFAE